MLHVGDHRLRKGYLGKKLGPQDRAIPAREGWYMQRLPRGANPWTDIYFFTQQVCNQFSSADALGSIQELQK